MDEKARRDEKKDDAGQRARSTETEERDASRPRREPWAEQPPLTRRETEDPWPIG